jgi:hypothetical protein
LSLCCDLCRETKCSQRDKFKFIAGQNYRVRVSTRLVVLKLKYGEGEHNKISVQKDLWRRSARKFVWVCTASPRSKMKKKKARVCWLEYHGCKNCVYLSERKDCGDLSLSTFFSSNSTWVVRT